MRLIDGDYLYNKLVANKCPYDLVLQMVKDEPTVNVLDKIRGDIFDEIKNRYTEVRDKSMIQWCNGKVSGLKRALEIIDKYR